MQHKMAAFIKFGLSSCENHYGRQGGVLIVKMLVIVKW